MGSTHSYISNPAHIATTVTEDNAESPSKWREYDYVIVGGGSAGCVIASRLSEEANTTVLLIEAGNSHEKEFNTKIPIAWPTILRSHVDWDYRTTPQVHAGNRVFELPRGKILGGTSSINGMIWQHCAPEDLDEWVRLGATGWSYDEIKPYILKSERFTPNLDHPGVLPTNHGAEGPCEIRYPKNAPIHKHILEACKEVGVEPIDDLNTAKGPRGAGTFAACVDSNGRRHSTAIAYLPPSVMKRPNLTVAIKTTTEKIMFSSPSHTNSDNPRAIGVQVGQSASGPKYRVRAAKEVVLCAGVIGTPQLLLLSNVGPKAELENLGLEITRDLPQVGKNYYDHISAGALIVRCKPGYTFDYLRNPLSALIALVLWFFLGKGPLSSLAGIGAAFIRSDDAGIPFDGKSNKPVTIRDISSGPNAPDIEVLWAPVAAVDINTPAPRNLHGVTFGAVALKPESSGIVTLKTTSAYDKPVVDPNFFASENDLSVVVRGVRFILRLARTNRLQGIFDPKEHETDQSSIFWPGDADPEQITDDEIKSFILTHCAAAFHPTSSCRIGQTPATGVVDSQLKVHGIDGLRICDASVFPSQLSVHPMATVVAVAEMAADIIKG